MARATLVHHDKGLMDGGFIVEMMIWRLPWNDPERPHGLKYSLYFGRDGEWLVGYDNERGKGDHRHFMSNETAYRFISVEKLIEDFMADIGTVRRLLKGKEAE